MKCPKLEDFIFCIGGKFQVEFYYNQKGEMPAKSHLEMAGFQAQLKLSALAKFIAESGRLFDITKFRQVDKKRKIYEFKPMSERFFNFFYKGEKIIITNGYRKQGQKVNRRELEKAINSKKDYESRNKRGDYYA